MPCQGWPRLQETMPQVVTGPHRPRLEDRPGLLRTLVQLEGWVTAFNSQLIPCHFVIVNASPSHLTRLGAIGQLSIGMIRGQDLVTHKCLPLCLLSCLVLVPHAKIYHSPIVPTNYLPYSTCLTTKGHCFRTILPLPRSTFKSLSN